MAEVVLPAEAVEDLADLDGAERKLVVKALGKLRAEPEKRGALTTFRKLVVGNRQFRIVYRVEPDGTVVVRKRLRAVSSPRRRA